MSFTTRPTLRGYGGAVSAGHYLAAQAGAQLRARNAGLAERSGLGLYNETEPEAVRDVVRAAKAE